MKNNLGMKKLNSKIIESQYALLQDTRYETMSELILRVVQTISRNEIISKMSFYEDKFYEIIMGNLFIPSGRILNNAGSKQSQMASCFVLPLKDDFLSIFDTLKLAANCHRLGGGTGFNFSNIREKGAPISTSESSGSSGPVSWIKLINSETSVVMSGGKRRGANIGVLSVYHPDILEFINCKNEFELKNFNLSVLIDNAFMDSLNKDQLIDLVSPLNKDIVDKIPARLVWENICKQAYKTGDPGLLFLEAINKNNPLKDKLGNLEIANPCGEQIMYSYESSFLGSINLLSFYIEAEKDLNWAKLKEVIYLGVRFLDNAIDLNVYPNQKIESASKAYRRIGLGIMGFADLLVKLRIPYDSEECLAFINKLGAFFKLNADIASHLLAIEKGVYKKSIYSNNKVKMRNVAVTAIAPTGTISMIANCSSGIEPRFAAFFNKDVIEDGGITTVDSLLLETLTKDNNLAESEVLNIIKAGKYKSFLNSSQLALFKYAQEIDYSWHIKVVAQWQKYIDNGISKTVNVPNIVSTSEISNLIKMAYNYNCKGITIYREGSHEKDLLISFKPEKQIIQSKEKSKLHESFEIK